MTLRNQTAGECTIGWMCLFFRQTADRVSEAAPRGDALSRAGSHTAVQSRRLLQRGPVQEAGRDVSCATAVLHYRPIVTLKRILALMFYLYSDYFFSRSEHGCYFEKVDLSVGEMV